MVIRAEVVSKVTGDCAHLDVMSVNILLMQAILHHLFGGSRDLATAYCKVRRMYRTLMIIPNPSICKVITPVVMHPRVKPYTICLHGPLKQGGKGRSSVDAPCAQLGFTA